MNTQEYIEVEDKYGAHNYHPLPVVLSKGEWRLCLGRRRQKVF